MIEILEQRNRISTADLYNLCNRMGWFTAGSNQQYEKLFDLNLAGAPLEDLALVIWICSQGETREHVLHTLMQEFGGEK